MFSPDCDAKTIQTKYEKTPIAFQRPSNKARKDSDRNNSDLLIIKFFGKKRRFKSGSVFWTLKRRTVNCHKRLCDISRSAFSGCENDPETIGNTIKQNSEKQAQILKHHETCVFLHCFLCSCVRVHGSLTSVTNDLESVVH